MALCSAAANAHVPEATEIAAGGFPWSFEPWVLACLALSIGLYAGGLIRLWRKAGRGRGIRTTQAAAFFGGWLALVLALVSPLDPMGARLFSAHMVQHEVLMVVAAPLLVVGRPLAAWAWALPAAWRPHAGRFFHSAGWQHPWRAITHPLAAWSLHALALWVWHVPSLFEAALADNRIHSLQHASFLGTALLFWWAVLGASSRRAQGAALLSLFTTMAHTGALGALMTLSPLVWYPAYAGTTAALGMEPLDDQQLGGIIMWVPAGLAYVAVGMALAARWIGHAEGGHPHRSQIDLEPAVDAVAHGRQTGSGGGS